MPSASSRRSGTWTSKRRATSCENFSGPDCSADSKSASAAQDTHGPGGPTVWVPESCPWCTRLQIQPRAPDQVRQALGGFAVDLFEVQVQAVAVLPASPP